jgi:DNA invertase Pin-like site-specific DNA recombinase
MALDEESQTCYTLGVKQVAAYLRVSTARQGASGLGIEAQRAAIQTYCADHGCEVAREFEEHESGRNNERPVLRQAIQYAKRQGFVLLIAKLDRLARNVAFIANLMDSDVEFAACDLPEANRLLLHIMAAIAEHEAKMIAERTKSALSAAKARGVRLGALNPRSRNLTEEAMVLGRARGSEAMKQKVAERDAEVLPLIRDLRAQKWSLALIAGKLNHEGYRTNPKTKTKWSAMQVKRALDRAAVKV